jgi:hypothetical protein
MDPRGLIFAYIEIQILGISVVRFIWIATISEKRIEVLVTGK